MSRSKEVVKEWVLERIMVWVGGIDVLEEASDAVQLDHLYGHIENDIMLHKTEVEVLTHYLDKELKDKLDILQYELHNTDKYKGYSMLEIDVLSIYADAWGYYCRPGTYSIS